jgi:site-specific DNA-methyltransferase (adenine-specific)
MAIRLKEREKAISEIQEKWLPNVVCGDSLMTMKDCPNWIKLLLTDSPYGQNFSSNRRVKTAKDSGIINDDDIVTATTVLTGVLEQAFDRMANDSHVLCFTSQKYEPDFRKAVVKSWFRYKETLIWVKPNHGAWNLASFAPRHECIIHAVKGNPCISPRIDTVLDWKEIVTDHPTSKPIDLLSKLIGACTIEWELVADPFWGHGSTAIAAKRMKRNFRISEIDWYNCSQIISNLLSC